MGGRGTRSTIATNARAIENMNQEQLEKEIERTESRIDRINSQLENFRVRDEYEGQFPLGVGFRSDKRYTQNIERAVKDASNYTELSKQLEDLERRNNSYKNALKTVKGTGKTQNQLKNETINRVASTSNTKWTKGKINGGTSYTSGEYRINNVEGTSFIYRNNERIGMADSLKKAKAYVEIHKKRHR